MKKILFVCSGNTCRSPLAEAIARELLDGAGVEVSSAGTSAMDGQPASRNSVAVARQHNLDITRHRARLLNPSVAREADLIVTMGSNHLQTVGVVAPEAAGHAYLLTDFSDEFQGDVNDPIGGGLEVYQETYEMIRACIEGLARKLPDFDGWKGGQ